MCGILGRVNFSGKIILKDDYKNPLKSLYHRGPDGIGFWHDKNIALGHTRLAIVDLKDTGSQPMISHDGRFVCVLNGEIYNYKEIKQKLAYQNYKWRGASDTEVLLQAWCKWGVKCIDQLDGMFSFVIWDKKDKELFVVRDRLGEKPLYYTYKNNDFGFSSRPSQIFSIFPETSRNYDNQSLRYYLESGYIPSDFSIFKDIKKLKAGHYLQIKNNKFKIQKYWEINNIETNQNFYKKSHHEIIEELDELLTESVKKRMRSDVPFGAFLSGGIDSSLVVAIMTKLSNNPIKTFTIGYNVKEYDESEHAEIISKYLKTDHYCKQLNEKDLINLLPDFLKNYDEPFFDSASFPTMAVSKLAKKKVSVILTGDGGDELFGGYHYYKIIKLLNYLNIFPKSFLNIISKLLIKFPSHKLKLLSSALQRHSTEDKFSYIRSIIKNFENVLDQNIINDTNGLKQLFENCGSSFPKKLEETEKAMRLDTLFTLNDDYLQKTDMATMAYSLEGRTPFLSHNIVEFAASMPCDLKLNLFNSKIILKKLAYNYIPKKILEKPKRGFGVPLDSWLRKELKEWSSERIYDKKNYENLPINHNKVIDLYECHLSGKRNVQPLLWAILMLLEFNSKNF